MKVGIYFGCFIPLHKGHWAIIQKAKKENDHIILGVCGYKNDRGEDFIPFCDRIKLIKELFKNDENTTISVVDDHKIGLTGTFSLEAWKIWSNELFNNSRFNSYDTSHKYTWYTGEPNYIEKIKTIFPKHNFSLVERNEIPISGTMIRENLNKYRDMIQKDFFQYLVNYHKNYQYYIYKITNNINGMQYVGQHKLRIHETPRGYMGKGIAIQKAYKEYGRQNFSKEIIEYIYDDLKHEKVSEREKFWIKKLNTLYPNGYNISEGGIGGCSKESAKKIVITRRLHGYRPTQETRNKISKAKKGKSFTKEHKNNLSKNHHLLKTWVIIRENGTSFQYSGSLHKFVKEHNISSFNKFIRYSYYKKFINGFYVSDIRKEDYAILRTLKGKD